MANVYLDHAATTPMLPHAIAAYAEAMAVVGNPASVHSQGQHAKQMLEEARERVAASLGADPIEVVFTSGGTEAVNLGIKGLYWQRQLDTARPRILVPGGEHHATMDTVEWLEKFEGANIDWLPLDELGRVPVSAVEAAVSSAADVALITMLWANNEVGTIQPIEQIAALATAHGVPLHVDAVSAYGHLPIDFRSLNQAGVAALSVSAHKIGGPVGIGALVLSRAVPIVPLIHGGGQQRQVRSGTQDVAAAVSFAVAASIAVERMDATSARLMQLRDRLISGVRAAVPEAILSGPDPTLPEPGSVPEEAHKDCLDGRLATNAHFTFPGCQGDSLLYLLDVAGISVSTGSACQAGIPEPSHVLRAMGRSEDEARGALRLTLGSTSTEADVDAFLVALPAAYAQASRAGLADRDVSLSR